MADTEKAIIPKWAEQHSREALDLFERIVVAAEQVTDDLHKLASQFDDEKNPLSWGRKPKE